MRTVSEDWFTVLTQKWQNLDSILLFGVYAMVQTGLSEREAVRTIADAEVFAHHERQPWQRPSGQTSRRARQRALWRKYQRLREQAKGA